MLWILQMSFRINFSSIFAHPRGCLKRKKLPQSREDAKKIITDFQFLAPWRLNGEKNNLLRQPISELTKSFTIHE
jgi:hypothetical protein